MTSATLYTDSGWNFSSIWKHSPTVNGGYPYFHSAWMVTTTPLTLSLSSPLSMTYGDSVLPSLSGLSIAGCSGCLTANWGSAIGSTTNAGTYAYASTANIFTLNWADGFDASNYDVTLPGGSLVINPRVVTLSTNSGATRAYNGLASAQASLFTLGNIVNSDTVALGGTATLDSIHAGARSVSSISNLTLNDNNYTLTGATPPTGTVAITPAAITAGTVTIGSRTYDGTATLDSGLINAPVQGAASGDTVSFTGKSGSFDSADAGSRTATINIGGISVSGAGNADDYAFTPVTNSPVAATISPKALTVNGATVAAKVYDGTTTGSASGGSLTGLIGSETLGFTPTATFTSANAGATAQVGATLTDGTNGGKATNYSVTPTADSTAITPRPIQAGKIYDGTTTFDGSGLVVQNLVSGDAVTGSGSGTLSDINAGASTLDTIGTLALDNGNYTLTGATFAILPRPVAVAAVSGATRVYDGSTNAGATLLEITNVVGSDTVGLSGNAALSGANAGTRSITGLTGLTLTNNTDGNYTLTGSTPSGNVTITARSVSVAAISGATRIYDGTTNAGAALFEITNVVTGDTVGLSGNAVLAGANTGTRSITDLSGLTLINNADGNYTLTGGTPSGSVVITARPVTVAAISGASKTYDGTTSIAATQLEITNVVTGDAVSLSGNAVLAGANAGPRSITGLTGLTLTNNADGNYTLTGGTPSGSVTIAPRQVILVPITGATRTYDGTTNAGAALFEITNVVGSDAVGLSGNAELAGANTGTHNITSLTGLSLTNNNYTLADSTPSGSVVITARPVTVAAVNGASKVYDGSANIASTLLVITNVVTGDTVGLSGNVALDSANAGIRSIAGLTGLTLTNNADGNYTLTGGTPGGSVTITARPVSVVAISGATKVYDGTTNAGAALLQIANVVGSDAVGLSGNAVLSGANTGTRSITSLTGLSLTNNNYTLTGGTPSGSVVITARPVSVVAVDGATKVYDGTTDIGAALLQIANVVGSDAVGLSGNTVLDSANAGTRSIAGLTGLTLTNNTDGNYTLTGGTPSGSVTITARPVSVVAVNGATKVYDGTTAVNPGLLQITNVVGSDSVHLGGSAALAGKGVGNQALLAGGLTVDNPNYTLQNASVSGSVAITPRVLDISFSVADKVFDGHAGVSANTQDNRVAGDQFSIDYTAAFADNTVGRNKPVTIGSLALNGPDAGNYQIAGGSGRGVTGSLLPRNVTYTLSSSQPNKLYVADGRTLVAPEDLDALVLVSWANTVAGTAPGALSYTIWKNGVQVESIREQGTYDIRAQFAAQDPHYAIADSGSTLLRIVVQDDKIGQTIASTITAPPASRELPVSPQPPTRASGSDGGGTTSFSNVVSVPARIDTAFGSGAKLAVVSAPNANEPTQQVTLSEARAMLTGSDGDSGEQRPEFTSSTASTSNAGGEASREVRVPVSRNSLAEIVNGGVRLPNGVEQQLFVVKSN